jgi:protoporphyrin/coproporphyrin ferrochelatase
MSKTAVILINTGTPDSPSVRDVRRYLSEFLGDARVITLPYAFRKMLVNGIIVPFRAPKSAKLYQKVWTEKGSPLLWHSKNLRDKLQIELGPSYEILLGMRYGNPSLKSALETAQQKQYSSIILFPLFPQYASSTSGSAIDFALTRIRKWNVIPSVKVMGQFYNQPDFIDAFVEKIKTKDIQSYEHILFSFHSLPISHVNATHHGKDCSNYNCTKAINEENSFCYHASCYETARLLAQKLSLKPDQFTVCFQSRFSKNWLSPFADKVVRDKATTGTKRMLIISPAFVTDCLETIVEIGDEYKHIFTRNGGETLDWVESLNDSDKWVSALAKMIREK